MYYCSTYTTHHNLYYTRTNPQIETIKQNPQPNMIDAIVVVLPQNNHPQPMANHNPQQLQPTTKPTTSSTNKLRERENKSDWRSPPTPLQDHAGHNHRETTCHNCYPKINLRGGGDLGWGKLFRFKCRIKNYPQIANVD